MYKLRKEFMIECAHKLENKELDAKKNRNLFDKCNRIHGHNYKIILCLKTRSIDIDTGMVLNFVDIKELFNKKIKQRFDHQFLNDDRAFEYKVTTAENMAKIFYDILKEYLGDLYRVEIYETPTAMASYEDDKNVY